MKPLKSFLPFLLQGLAGIAIPLSMAPYNWHLLAYIALAYFLYGLNQQSLKRSILLGYCFGLGLFGWGASWIYVSIYKYGNTHASIAALITLLFVMILALFPAITAWLLNLIAPKPRLSRTLLVFPSLWVAMEMLRGWLFTGFPWLYAGYSQHNLTLSYFAPYGAIWSVSLATALMGALLYALFDYFRTPNRTLAQGLPIFACLIGLWGTGVWIRHDYRILTLDPGIDVALLQGNIEQSMKWDTARANHIVQTYYKMTQDNLDADIVIWPETAIPWPIPFADNFLKVLDSEAKLRQTSVITGIPEQANQSQFYNSIIAIGEGNGIYRKQHLVPFGEYVPLEKWLRGVIGFFDLPMSSFIAGAPNQPPLIAQGLKIAPTICYEIAYPELVRNNAKNSDILLTLSNDAWFGYSIGPHQHQQIAQFRALETGKYLIRGTNTGWTTIITPEGDIIEEIPRFEQNVLKGTVRASATQTFWMQYGLTPIASLLAILFLSGVIHQSWLRYRKR